MTSANSHSSVVSHCQPLQTVNVSGQASVDKSLAPASQTGMVTTTTVASTSKVTRVGAITQTPGKGTVLAVPRVSTPQQNGTPQAAQTTTIQLPANFKIPQGMVLIRSDRGQLMLVSQQALAQAQGAGLPRPAATTPTLRASTPKETVENAKKCKNFLVTLIKLASSGTHSAEMAKNVKELVRNLLDAKIEPEEFTNRLYTELKSSPQPYLVPFLKKSLPAVRQLTPNSQLFIQQCVLQKDGIVSTAAIAAQQAVKQTSVTVVANSKTIEPAELAQPVKPAQPPKPAQMIVQQPRGVVIKPPASITQSQQSTQIVNRIQLKTPVTTTVRSNLYPAGTVVKQAALLGPKAIRVHFKENGAALFRLLYLDYCLPKSAFIELIKGFSKNQFFHPRKLPSCARLFRGPDQTAGKRHGITEVNPDVVSLVSHATQERLRTLVEKMTVASQHRTRSYKTIGNGDVTGASQSAIPKQFSRLRTTRATLKDLIFCMEQEQAMRQSITLYRAFLK
ncbi:Transcription initiation factor TFIID subunit 4 [Acipenser ruthenus]|uniref:Transcription initiation factor TFIID subunit 4 n=1 Tax=Acipenser ruthenus TaxID=7906 RepID=A0A444U1G2_ACIRT|nr:Transcription initiation factor TFIID subunit 4 [Acipenser ruthenus]